MKVFLYYLVLFTIGVCGSLVSAQVSRPNAKLGVNLDLAAMRAEVVAKGNPEGNNIVGLWKEALEMAEK